ncbi:hypothetical protein QL288_01065 [Citrobacter youngae]|nr:hypothetical protein [Citrobacter youngae]
MGKMTFVVEFEDGKEPPVSADMDVAGGRLVAAAFHDYRSDLLTEDEVSAVIGSCREHGRDFEVWCDEFQVEPEEIERKLNLMG